MAKNVFSGLVTACRFAGCPTSCSPSALKATIDGVVRIPSAFSMTFGLLPSITATHELVVPRSIPITFAISEPLFLADRPGPEAAPETCARRASRLAWRRSPSSGMPADSSGRVPRLYRRQPYGPQGEAGTRTSCRRRSSCDALPGANEDRREAIIAAIGGSFGHVRLEGLGKNGIGDTELGCRCEQALIDADQHVS